MECDHVPSCLLDAFPTHCWRSLKQCSLRVNQDGSAGIDVEASQFGYLIESVGNAPGQDASLTPGVVVACINDEQLFGLDEDVLESTFGAHFADGAMLTLIGKEELEQVVDHNAPMEIEEQAEAISDIVSEHGSLVRVQVAAFCSKLNIDWAALFGDLDIFSKSQSVRVEISQSDSGPPFEVVLAGAPEDVTSSRSELRDLLQYYCISNEDFAGAAEDVYEVDGLVLQSRPARERRRGRRKNDKASMEVSVSPDMVAPEAQNAGSMTQPGTKLSQGGDDELRQFEYMDHTADVILHSWGRTMEEAFAQICVSFFGYLTELDTVDSVTQIEVEATGHDVLDLLYHLLDEFLFSFGTELVVCRHIAILELDMKSFRVKARGTGERFNLKKHPQGTEIKAITMHQMKILSPESLTTEEGTVPRKQSSMEGGSGKEGFPFECYVLVDI